MPKPLLTARYRVVVRDAQGKIKRIEEAPSKSFILNFLYAWWLILNGNGTDSISGVNSSGQPVTTTLEQPWGWIGPVNNLGSPYAGIQVGSGTSPPSASSPYLESLILSGTGSGQLVYGTNIMTSPLISTNPGTMQITNTFTNNSGGSVTVGEIGFAPSLGNWQISPITYGACLFIHDVLSPAASVPNGGTITVTYTLQVNT